MIARSLLATLTLGTLAGTAAAQSTRYPPPVPDLDAEREEQSDFWENAVEPGRERYDDLLDRAAKLLRSRAPDARVTAIELLEEATGVLPSRADAWAWLGLAHEAGDEFPACHAALEKAWLADPDWAEAPRPIGVALGVCRARDADLDGATELLESLVARDEESVEAMWRLGEVYIVLGRLDDARAVLEVALDQSPADPSYVHAAWALAVAADRARDPDATRAAAEIALRHDPERVRVEEPPHGFLLDADRAYAAGVAGEAYGGDVEAAPERALLGFRRYLAAVSDGPWVTRAEEHVKALRGFETRDRVKVWGTDKVDGKKVGKAVDKIDAALQACVKAVPRTLLTVDVIVHGPPYVAPSPDAKQPRQTKKAKKAKPKPQPKPPPPPPPRDPWDADDTVNPYAPRGPSLPPEGAEVQVFAGDELPDVVEPAIECVRKVAAGASFPAPATPGTYVRITFPVISR